MKDERTHKAWGYLGSGILIWLGIIILAGVVALYLRRDVVQAAPQKNAQAPEFSLNNLNGEKILLKQTRGKAIVLNFWATWCGPCVIEMPSLQKYYEKYPEQLEILAINADEPEVNVRQFVYELGLTFDILLDPGGNIQELYNIQAYPTSYFLDRDRVIRAQHIGSFTEEQLGEYLAMVGVGP
jgi:thiol-disulfide isomerase/thioredoxin